MNELKRNERLVNVRPVVRAAAPIAVVASLTMTLTACGSSSKSGSAADCAQPGSQSNSVTASGEYGKTPTVSVKGTLKATGVQRTVVIKGTGAQEATDATVQAHITFFDATGKQLAEQDAYLPLDSKITTPAIVSALGCVNYGSRTVTTGRGSDYFPGTQPTGINAADTYIVVADVEKAFVPDPWTTQVPTVTFDKSGMPTVKLAGQPLANWAVKVLQEGTGAVVKAGDNVTLNYQGTSWNTGKIFDQSYGKQPATFNTTQVVPGFGNAIVGQKVGTKLVVTIPPALAYGTDTSASQLANQTLVFVIDIQSAAAATPASPSASPSSN